VRGEGEGVPCEAEVNLRGATWGTVRKALAETRGGARDEICNATIFRD